MSDTVEVMHLCSEIRLTYQGVSPREAVRNAYATITCRDGNTWEYAKYDCLVFCARYTVVCGEWCALIDNS